MANREKDTILDFLRSIPDHLKRTLQTVYSVRCAGYTEAIFVVLLQVRLMIDHFPVTEAYRDGLDTLHKKEGDK